MHSTEALNEKIKQLNKIRKVASSLSVGALPQHYFRVVFSGLLLLVVLFAIKFITNILPQNNSDFQMFGSVYFIGYVVASVMLMVHFTDKSHRSHALHLDQLLADYTPVSTEAFRDLQSQVVEEGMKSRYIFEWLEEEEAAIKRASSKAAAYIFTNKEV